MRKGGEYEKSTKAKNKLPFLIKTPSKDEAGKPNPCKEHCRVGLSRMAVSSEERAVCKDYSFDIPAGEYSLSENPNKSRMHNHLEFNWNLSNKKALFYNMKGYYAATSQNPFEFIPLTFHIHNSRGE